MRHLLTRLTHATAASATAVDSALVGPLLAQPSAAAYRTFLCTLYGFVAPLETSLVMTYGLDFAFLAPRIRSGYIATDLLSLGLTTGDFHRLAHRHDVPPFTCTADALGWLFVSERITPHLGRLYPRLTATLRVDLATASTFRSPPPSPRIFLGGASWPTPSSCSPPPTPAPTPILAAARSAFTSQRAWLGSPEFVAS